jgi:hypothetical protein
LIAAPICAARRCTAAEAVDDVSRFEVAGALVMDAILVRAPRASIGQMTNVRAREFIARSLTSIPFSENTRDT